MSAEEFKAKGNKALQEKHFDEAIKCYTQAIELDSTQHVYFSNRSAAYLSKGDAENALKDAEQCIAVNPAWAKGFSRKGAALHALKLYPEARAAYEDGLKIAPSDAALKSGLEDVKKAEASQHFGVGGGGAGGNPLSALFGPEALLKMAGHPKFGAYLNDPAFMAKMRMMQSNPSAMGALFQDPQMMEVLSFLMGIDIKGGGPGGAAGGDESDPFPPSPPPREEKRPEPPVEEPVEEDLTEEEKAKKKKKLDAQDAKDRGNKHYSKKEFAEALGAYDEACKHDPTNMTFLTNKAAVYLEQGHYQKCIDQCKEAIELGRANRADYADVAKAFVRIGKAQLKMEDLNGALESFRHAQVENYTKDVEKLIKQTEKIKKTKEEEAYIDADKAKEAKERGNELYRSGNFVDAIKEYQEAIKRDPKEPSYRNNLAATLAKLGDFPGAKEACEKAIELDPRYVKAWAKKGDIEFFMKEFHKALDSYRQGLEIEPGNSLCLQGLQKTQMKIQQASSSGEVDMERAAHGMADPEVQAILADPVIRQVLQDLNENPAAGRQALGDPGVRAKIEKLIAAGVLRTG